jgi:hypothetical protein
MRRWLLLSLFFPALASAQNPAWPNRAATVESLRDPANWPDDPDYGYDISGRGSRRRPRRVRAGAPKKKRSAQVRGRISRGRGPPAIAAW